MCHHILGAAAFGLVANVPLGDPLRTLRAGVRLHPDVSFERKPPRFTGAPLHAFERRLIDLATAHNFVRDAGTIESENCDEDEGDMPRAVNHARILLNALAAWGRASFGFATKLRYSEVDGVRRDSLSLRSVSSEGAQPP